jgi:hypothetical protein
LGVLQGAFLQAEPIGLRLPDTSAVVGETLDLPVYVDSSLSGESVLAYQLRISFDDSLLQVAGVSVVDHLGAPFGAPAVNLETPGQITLAAAGVGPLVGSGVLLTISFETHLTGESILAFTEPESNFFNEGSPALILNDGSFSISPQVSSPASAVVPQKVSLEQNFPNPFNPTTMIRYGIPEILAVSLVIYDLQGRVVRSYSEMAQPAGWVELLWNGTDDEGHQVCAGVYIFRLRAGDHAAAIKMILLK